jgi:CheY-like chemotaxis protein
VEAFETGGEVKINLIKNKEQVHISVEDNGKGIPKDIQKQLFESGKTFGKKSGNGLGLFHAKETIKSWGGEIKIDSTEGKGTKVTITLPQTQPDSWFLSSINLQEEFKIVVLDDDPSIHQVWKERFRPIGYQIISFSEPSSFKKYIKSLPNLKNTLILSDYELIGHKETGIDLIDELGIAQYSVLVTSHYDESKIIKDCKRLHLSLVPKSMAGIVPISVDPCERYDLVYIDDDKYLRMAWEMEAKKKNKKILSLCDSSQIESILPQLTEETPFFLDRDLGEGKATGEVVAKNLYDKGFKNLYLCTGYRKEDLPEMPWIKDVLPKNIDFINLV